MLLHVKVNQLCTDLKHTACTSFKNTGAETTQTKAKVGTKKVESVESEADTLPKSLHMFHGDDYLDFEV